MHGDFLAAAAAGTPGVEVGGIALLSGYLRQVREEDDVLYINDVLQGYFETHRNVHRKVEGRLRYDG